jgi:glycerophosphoryl diester phosphodiesterase
MFSRVVIALPRQSLTKMNCQDFFLESTQKSLTKKRQFNPQFSIVSSLINSTDPVLVAHGKNFNMAPESTWNNIKNTLEVANQMPLVLELDLQLTKDNKFILAHDPTFHRLSKNYSTTKEKINNFWLLAMKDQSLYSQALEAEKKGSYVFNLFDGASNYTLVEIKKNFKIYDSRTQIESPIISLEEVLRALTKKNRIVIPKYKAKLNNSIVKVILEVIPFNYPIAIYFDIKVLNNLARRYNHLNTWDWIKNSWSLEKLENYATDAIKEYSYLLNRFNYYENAIITVRDPKIFELVKMIDPKIKMMISSEILNQDSTTEDFFNAFKDFIKNHSLNEEPLLVEVKYLQHILNRDIRNWSLKYNLHLFYNQIAETDTQQFEGRYKNNLNQLLEDILISGKNIWIQTNTVEGVADFLIHY